VALVAATLFPLRSEALRAGLLIAGKQPVWMRVAIASVGNVVGSTINWVMEPSGRNDRDDRLKSCASGAGSRSGRVHSIARSSATGAGTGASAAGRR